MGCLGKLIHTPADSGRTEGPSGDAARRPPVHKALRPPPPAAAGRPAAGKLARSGVARVLQCRRHTNLSRHARSQWPLSTHPAPPRPPGPHACCPQACCWSAAASCSRTGSRAGMPPPREACSTSSAQARAAPTARWSCTAPAAASTAAMPSRPMQVRACALQLADWHR